MEITTTHPVAVANRTAINQLGLWLFIASETMLFAAFITARFYLAGLSRPEGINESLGAVMTLVLILSSILAYRGQTALRRGDRRTMLQSFLGTLILGGLFVVGVGIEWSTAEFSIASPYGTTFFSTTGLHLAHLLSGLIVLTLIWRLAWKGHFSPDNHAAILVAIRYWTFVDALWVLVIYPVFYLI